MMRSCLIGHKNCPFVRKLIKGPFTRKEGYPCARVALASGLKIARVYKQISQVGLPNHLK